MLVPYTTSRSVRSTSGGQGMVPILSYGLVPYGNSAQPPLLMHGLQGPGEWEIYFQPVMAEQATTFLWQ